MTKRSDASSCGWLSYGATSDVRALIASTRVYRLSLGCALLIAFIVVSGNGSPAWWSGLPASLLLCPFAICFAVATASRKLDITPDQVRMFGILCAMCAVALISLLINPLTKDSVVVWASAYASPIAIYVTFTAVRWDRRGAALLVLIVALGALPILIRGGIAFYKNFGIPTGLELLLARYDLPRMGGYMRATFGNTSNMAAFLALVLPMLLSACLQRTTRIPFKLALIAALALSIIHALIVQSRTLFMVLLPVVIATTTFHGLRFRRTVAALAAALLAVAIPAIGAVDQLVNLTIGSLSGREGDESVNERMNAMRFGLRLVWDHPAFGIGPGNAPLVNPYASAHQFWIQQGSELGLIGLVLSVLFSVAIVGSCLRTYWSERGTETGALRFTLLIGPASFIAYGTIANMPLAQYNVNTWVGLLTICVASAAGLRPGGISEVRRAKDEDVRRKT